MRHLLALLLVSAFLSSSAGQHNDAMMFFPTEIKWMDAPASLPKGAKIAILEGDLSKEVAFVFRVKLPDGYRIAPHFHPRPERVTVISGVLNFGMGDKYDETKLKAMPAGSYGTWPAGMKHFASVKGETILQLHGIGPWTIQYVNPAADDPRHDKK